MKESSRYFSLDLMRGVAAILVVLYHYGRIGLDLSPRGFIAVDLFFVLSGFVLDRAYTRRLTNGLGLRQFALIRCIRLYPLYLLGISIGFIVAVAAIVVHDSRADTLHNIITYWALNAVMIPALTWSKAMFPLDGPGWSLFFEAIANVIFAILLFRLSTRSLLFIVIISGAGVLYFSNIQGTVNIGWDIPTFLGGLSRVFYSFPLGIIFSRVVNMRKIESWFSLLPVLVLAAAMCLPRFQSYDLAIDQFMSLFLCPAIVFVGIVFELPSSLMRYATVLGDASYPLYITHFPSIFAFHFAVSKIGIPIGAETLAFLVIAVLMSIFLDHAYDHPIRRYLTRNLLEPDRKEFSKIGQL